MGTNSAWSGHGRLRPRGGLPHPPVALLLAFALALAGAIIVLPLKRAEAACSGNAIVCENQLPGTPRSVWDVQGVGDRSIQGYATAMSVNVGSSISFKVDTDASAYTIKIYRLGYYGGDGAREVATIQPSASLPQTQPACATDPATEIYDCGSWSVSASWDVPATAVSGIYIARLIRSDTGGDSHIPFVVRDDGNTSAVLFQTSDSSWQAYNPYGGSDFYQGHTNGRAYKVSYNRPFTTRGVASGRDYLFANEYPMLRFLEQNGYDVSYVSGLDVHRDASLVGKHKVFLSVGHDEYWSGPQRTHVTAARDAGVNMAYFSGNEVYWKTRWEPSEDGTATADRTLVCYKDTWENQQIDPVEPTPTWRDPRFGDLGQGPENSLTGTIYMANSDDLPITVNSSEAQLRLWRNTSLPSMAPGDSTPLADHTVGYESDEDSDNGYRPAGLIDMSTTVGSTPEYLQDFGKTVAPGTTTHHLTQYRAPSGALVFGAGTVQWSWGLDSTHDGVAEPADPRIRQATVNILADMGALATTVAPDLIASTTSTDTTPPTSTITSPTSGSSATAGSLITVKGTASDTGGNIGGVEVSVDGGASFHPAVGRESFTYTDVLTGSGPNAVQARATDDSGRMQPVPTSVAVDAPCPCSIFGATTPRTSDSGDSAAVTLGTKFSTSVNGYITGIRFYKSSANTGTHTGTLYSSSGTVLGTGTFTAETASGWQMLNFDTAVPVTAGSVYVAAYSAPSGHYAADANFFAARSFKADTLTALGGPSTPNGVYGRGTAFPTTSYKQTNYYVDAVFGQTDTTPLAVTGVAPTTDGSSVLTTAAVTAKFSRDVTSSSVAMSVIDPDNVAVPGTVSYDTTTRTAKFTPAQPMAASTRYTATVSATTAENIGMAAPYQWSFTTVRPANSPGICPCTVFDETDQPTGSPDSASTPVQVGVAFTAKYAGVISGIRFFKQLGNNGSHTVKLSSTDGTPLATATVATESTAGWQQADFDSPVSISAGTTYIASYQAPVGHYSYLTNGLATALSRSPLTTLATGGRYTYGTGAPTTASKTNYFVDPVFNSAPGVAPKVAALSPGSSATSVPVTASVRATFDGQIQPSSAQISVTAADGTQVVGSSTSESLSSSVTFTPSSPLDGGTKYTVTVSGAKSASGTPMSAPYTSSFTTSGAQVCPCSLLETTTQPTVSDSNDAAATTVGLKFSPSVSGYIRGLRYYRDAANTGTHTGALYSSGGSKLASVTFSDSGTGWQSANFSTAVPVTAGTTYVASYYAPVGHYSASSNYFTNPVQNSPLSSVGSGGVYAPGNAFPNRTYLNTNYYVDVIFTTADTDPPTVTDVSPASGATAAVSSAVRATFARAITESSLIFSLTGPDGSVSGQLSYDASSRTVEFRPAVDLAPATSYTASLSATSTGGVTMDAPKTWTFSTAAAPPTGQPVSLFPSSAVPASPSYNDNGPVTVGVRFSSTTAGQLTAIKFYAGAGNTGTQKAVLYSSTGTELASGTTSVTTTGWRTVTFATPVAIAPNTVYVATYYAPAGHYALTTGAFSAPYTSGPLTVAKGGGTYRYPSGYPTATSTSNYWVDVVVVI